MKNPIDFKYILIGGTIGALLSVSLNLALWFARARLPFAPIVISGIYISIEDILISLMMAIISVYIGLWIIGKVRASPREGAIVGLVLMIIGVPITLLAWVAWVGTQLPAKFIWSWVGLAATAIIIEYAIGGLIGGLIGGIIVQRLGPKYCPRCGAKVPIGAIYCNKCGTKVVGRER